MTLLSMKDSLTFRAYRQALRIQIWLRERTHIALVLTMLIIKLILSRTMAMVDTMIITIKSKKPTLKLTIRAHINTIIKTIKTMEAKVMMTMELIIGRTQITLITTTMMVIVTRFNLSIMLELLLPQWPLIRIAVLEEGLTLITLKGR